MLAVNEIYHGDSLSLLPQIPDKSIDLIVTDPPYILRNTRTSNGCLKYLKKVRNELTFIEKGFSQNEIFEHFVRIQKKVNAYIFCSNLQIADIMYWFQSKGYIVTLLCWYKTNMPPFIYGTWKQDLEFCIHIREKGATFHKGNSQTKSKLYISPYEFQEYHPTQKPPKLIKQYIELSSNENDVVLDCFLGSGTTAVACVNTNRRYIGIEKEAKYYEIAKRRVAEAKENLGLFRREE